MADIQVEEIEGAAIGRGDVVWAHDDGDWLKVARVAEQLGTGWIVYRTDGSEATFPYDKPLLRRVS